jgi:glycosyltransferase involved in cell wall biosynthesis
VVTCHDLDTFRCLLEPERDPRGPLFRAMVRRILDGFRAARHVACVTTAVRDEVLRNGLIPAERLSVVHNGVDAVCSPTPDATADSTAARLLSPIDREGPLLLHVGSCIARKRIDLLLHVLHRCAESYPNLRLLRAGGALRPDQRALADRLGVSHRIISLPFLTRGVLAAVYRRASLVLQPSSAEGFGLPVIEALACGTAVIASDLPVLREVGGDACMYCPVGDINAWVSAVNGLLSQRDSDGQLPRAHRAAGVAQAARFSWAEHTRRMIGIYETVRAH